MASFILVRDVMIKQRHRGTALLRSRANLYLSSPPGLSRTTPRCRRNYALVSRYKSTSSTGEAASSASSACNNSIWYAIMTKNRKAIGSFSTLSGHTASICTLLAYLNTDILALRALAMASGVCNIVFQYYRPQPLWLPLKWNALLLLINGYMVTALLIERYEADHMPPEMETLYNCGGFDERGFSKVQFMNFFGLGRGRVFARKDFITHEGKEMDKLFYIVDGNATVTSAAENRKLATITPHDFIGEMAFLVYTQNYQKDSSAEFSNASAHVTADSGLVHVWEWDANQLAAALKEDRELSNAFASYCSHDLRKKLLSANAQIAIH